MPHDETPDTSNLEPSNEAVRRQVAKRADPAMRASDARWRAAERDERGSTGGADRER